MITYELDYEGLKFEVTHMGAKGDDYLGLIYTGSFVGILFFKDEAKGTGLIPPKSFHPDAPMYQQTLATFMQTETAKKYSPKLVAGEVQLVSKTEEVPEDARF